MLTGTYAHLNDSYRAPQSPIDGNLMLVPLVSRGVEENEAYVHAGFLISYNSVRNVVLRAVREQLEAFPGYVVVLAGMSID